MLGLRAAKELSDFLKTVGVSRYEIFLFLFWKAITIFRVGTKKQQGPLAGLAETQVGHLF